jgi:hypothetical protein
MKPGSKEDLLKIIEVVAEKTASLVERTIGRSLSISYLTIFSHHAHEYERFIGWAEELGQKSEANNGLRFVLNNPIQTKVGAIEHIRIRKPDVYRSQLGCADFEVEDYGAFKRYELPKYPNNLRLIERPEYEMLEFFDFDNNDVLAYIISK